MKLEWDRFLTILGAQSREAILFHTQSDRKGSPVWFRDLPVQTVWRGKAEMPRGPRGRCGTSRNRQRSHTRSKSSITACAGRWKTCRTRSSSPICINQLTQGLPHPIQPHFNRKALLIARGSSTSSMAFAPSSPIAPIPISPLLRTFLTKPSHPQLLSRGPHLSCIMIIHPRTRSRSVRLPPATTI